MVALNESALVTAAATSPSRALTPETSAPSWVTALPAATVTLPTNLRFRFPSLTSRIRSELGALKVSSSGSSRGERLWVVCQ